MNTDFEKLKQIFVDNPDLDSEDSRENIEEVTQMEREFEDSRLAKDWKEHELSKRLMVQAQESYIDLALRLANDRQLTEQERLSMYAKQDAMMWFMNLVERNPEKHMKEITDKVRRAIKSVQ